MLAGIAARSLYVLTTPAFSAVYQQISLLHAADRFDEIAELYRLGTRLLMAVIFPAAIFVTVHSTVIFSGWTGDPKLAKSLSVVVGLLLFGTALNSAMQFPYALQLSSGRSHLPLIINIALLVVFVPLLILLSLRFGVVGAAAAWAILNTLYLFLGIWVTHRTLLPGVGLRWLSADEGAPLLAGLVIVGGGGATLRSTVLPAPVTAAVGLIFAGVAFVAVVSLTPGMAEFARRMFAFRRPLFEARA